MGIFTEILKEKKVPRKKIVYSLKVNLYFFPATNERTVGLADSGGMGNVLAFFFSGVMSHRKKNSVPASL